MKLHLFQKVLLSISVLTLAVMACGVPVVKSPKPYPPIVTFPVPSRTVTESPAPSERVACTPLTVRAGPGVEYKRESYVIKGYTVNLTGRWAFADDNGLWLQVVDRNGKGGWVNARYLCD